MPRPAYYVSSPGGSLTGTLSLNRFKVSSTRSSSVIWRGSSNRGLSPVCFCTAFHSAPISASILATFAARAHTSRSVCLFTHDSFSDYLLSDFGCPFRGVFRGEVLPVLTFERVQATFLWDSEGMTKWIS